MPSRRCQFRDSNLVLRDFKGFRTGEFPSRFARGLGNRPRRGAAPAAPALRPRDDLRRPIAMIAVEFAHQFDQAIHRVQIARPHHRAREDHRFGEPGELQLNQPVGRIEDSKPLIRFIASWRGANRSLGRRRRRMWRGFRGLGHGGFHVLRKAMCTMTCVFQKQNVAVLARKTYLICYLVPDCSLAHVNGQILTCGAHLERPPWGTAGRECVIDAYALRRPQDHLRPNYSGNPSKRAASPNLSASVRTNPNSKMMRLRKLGSSSSKRCTLGRASSRRPASASAEACNT